MFDGPHCNLLLRLPIDILPCIVTLRDGVRLASVCKALRFVLTDVLVRLNLDDPVTLAQFLA
jgi:hypothetical protein